MAQSSNNAIKYLRNIHLLSTRGDICGVSSYHKIYAKITFNSQRKENRSEGRVLLAKQLFPNSSYNDVKFHLLTL